jgi:hypothetical protein
MYAVYSGKKLIWLPQHIDETIFALHQKQQKLLQPNQNR